jgi:peptidoglycan hydrolase-like protein with peptidoglycan-binding domain
VNSRAVYSRTPIRSARAQAGGRRAAIVRQPVVYTPQVPSQDRYREIQQALLEKGFFKGEPDGKWTPESVAALKEFQKAQNLEADGKLGSLSLGPKRIVSAQNNPPQQPPPPPQPQL